MIWVLEETPTPGVYQLGFFGEGQRRRPGGLPGRQLALWTALVGSLEQFEQLGTALLAETAARRAQSEAAG